MSSFVTGLRPEVYHPVCRTDDIQIMLYHDDGMPFGKKRIEGFQQFLNIIEMKSRGRLIKDEQDLLLLGPAYRSIIHGEEISKFDALAFTSRQGAAALAQLDIRKTDVDKRLKPLRNPFGRRIFLSCKEGYRLLHAHIQDVIYIESLAKVTTPTETGKLMYKYADQFYVQWEGMLEYYPNAIYKGGIY